VLDQLIQEIEMRTSRSLACSSLGRNQTMVLCSNTCKGDVGEMIEKDST
jgi:hypothetical protein